MRPRIPHLDGTVDLLLRLRRRGFPLRLDRRSQRADSRSDTVQRRRAARVDRDREREHLLVFRRLQISHRAGL